MKTNLQEDNMAQPTLLAKLDQLDSYFSCTLILIVNVKQTVRNKTLFLVKVLIG